MAGCEVSGVSSHSRVGGRIHRNTGPVVDAMEPKEELRMWNEGWEVGEESA